MAVSTTRRTYGQACPVAHGLDVVGERWTLLIVRDLVFGPLRFGELRDGLRGLAPNLLSERLRLLLERGIVERVDAGPPSRARVYRLTARGRELSPVIHHLARFGVAEWADPDEHPPSPRLVRGALLAVMDTDGLDASGWSADVTLGEIGIVGVTVGAETGDCRGLSRLRLADGPTEEASARVRTTLGTLRDLRLGHSTTARAVEQGRLTVEGPRSVQDQLAALFGWT